MPKPRVLVDSCVIIEACRTKVWKALTNHFDVETVECCVVECCTGDIFVPGRVPLNSATLRAELAMVHPVDDDMLAAVGIDFHDLPAMDPGEFHLLAWLHANPGQAVMTVLSTADRAAIRGTHVMNLMDRVTSLEELAKQAHVGRNQLDKLQGHFMENWLSQVRMQLRTGVL
ncbi:hypothetical protein [Roseateles saccharophilus]|uniref:PIN domain-containing protein n=1 Tax=Roseateles saccharophilus TaxID=304 RepID=A0A4V2VNS6_ROSSA|nr:hypothetical protein [Roseateles saccharophilus]MDG0835752.1 hypothetical protein [Roseateles saccharophilus]TCU84477.1 hypothetical protein EV671_105323 [Roseateles saccharophilus]